MWLQSVIIASVVSGAPACEGWQADIADIDSTRYAGELDAAIEKVEQLRARCPARSADDDIQLHLLLAKIHDRIGLHNNTRPVARVLAEIEMARDLRDDGNARSAASIELAYAKYYYRAEMSERLFEKAEAHARRAIAEFEAIEDRRGLADAVHALGLIHFQRGELNEARSRFVESLQLENRDPEPRAEMLADYNRHMAFVLVRENRRDDALPLFRKSFEQRRDGGLRDASIFAAISYGNSLVELGRADEAQEPLAYALELAYSIESPEGIARAMGAMARMHDALGRLSDDKELEQ
jgi:tetratricopeptide (TPR) repeat protein